MCLPAVGQPAVSPREGMGFDFPPLRQSTGGKKRIVASTITPLAVPAHNRHSAALTAPSA